MSMEHDKLSEQLSAYLDGALDERERADVEKRIESEAEVRTELARLRETIAWTKNLPHASAPDSVLANVLTRIKTESEIVGHRQPMTDTRNRWKRLRTMTTIAACLMVAVGLTIWGAMYSTRELFVAVGNSVEKSSTSPTTRDDVDVPQYSPAADQLHADSSRPESAVPKGLPTAQPAGDRSPADKSFAVESMSAVRGRIAATHEDASESPDAADVDLLEDKFDSLLFRALHDTDMSSGAISENTATMQRRDRPDERTAMIAKKRRFSRKIVVEIASTDEDDVWLTLERLRPFLANHNFADRSESRMTTTQRRDRSRGREVDRSEFDYRLRLSENELTNLVLALEGDDRDQRRIELSDEETILASDWSSTRNVLGLPDRVTRDRGELKQRLSGEGAEPTASLAEPENRIDKVGLEESSDRKPSRQLAAGREQRKIESNRPSWLGIVGELKGITGWRERESEDIRVTIRIRLIEREPDEQSPGTLVPDLSKNPQ
jgi:anti-sigma factor RsiW